MEKAFRIILAVLFISSSCRLSAQPAKEELYTKQEQSNKDTDTPPKKIKELKVGDVVPDIEFSVLDSLHPTINLSSFKGKLILLDFWSTWCHACVANLSKLDTLQHQFGNRIQVILVNSVGTGDTKDRIKKFLQRFNTEANTLTLPITVNDSLAETLFPHRVIPHYVWITPSGRVQAITASEPVNFDNIERSLKGEALDMPAKKDFFPARLLNMNGQETIDDNMAAYSLFKKGRIEGLEPVNLIRRVPVGTSTETRGYALLNISLLEMYETGLSLQRALNGLYTPKRLLLEIKDSSKLIFKPGKETQEKWEAANLYTLDFVIPACTVEDLGYHVFEELNTYSAYFGRIEKRKVSCLQLVYTGNVEKNKKEKKGKKETATAVEKYQLAGANGDKIALELNRQTKIPYPVINRADIRATADLVWDINDTDFSGIRKQLIAQGFDLVLTEQEIDMLVISDKKMNGTQK